MSTVEELKALYRETGAWVVSTQEVICCQQYHGNQDEMLKKMHEEDIYFYIFDASVGSPDRPRINYMDRLRMFATGKPKPGRIWMMLEPEIPLSLNYKEVHFVVPTDARPPFAGIGTVLDYIPPKMPGFIGPMPQIQLTEGSDYHNVWEHAAVAGERFMEAFKEAMKGVQAPKISLDSFADFGFKASPIYLAEEQKDVAPKNRPKGPRRTKNQRGAWWNK